MRRRREFDQGRFGGWIRPVSGHGHGEVAEADRRFRDGTDPALFDIIDIPMLKPKPHAYQAENHLIDARVHWRFVRKATSEEVVAASDGATVSLWDNSSSTRKGLRDRVLPSQASNGSLRFIEVLDLQIQVSVEGARFDNPKRKTRGQFTFNSILYRFSVTDPRVERAYLEKDDGLYPVGKALLCISLGDVNETDGYAYKLIASVTRLKS